MDYQKRFADYLRNQSPTPMVTPSVTGSVYQNRFADYLRNQSLIPNVTSSVTDSGTGNVDYAARFADWMRRNRSGVTEKVVPSSAPTQSPTQSVKIPTAQTFSLGRTMTSGGAMPESVRYATDNAAIGQYGRGNIDLYHRPQYRYEDGSVATVRSMSFNENGQEILIPTIAFDNTGKAVELTDDEAIDRYHRTGEYLGKFSNIAEADLYAEQLHRAQDYYYNRTGRASPESKREQGASGMTKATRDLTSGANHNVIVDLPAAAKKAVSAPFAAASNALTRAGTALDKATTGKDYNTAIRAARWERYTKPTLSAPQENPYQADAEALANVAHMTDAEQVHALELSGDSERGAYIQSLNLTSRRRAAESESRAKTAAAFEANIGKAVKRESPEGRVIAANATWNPSYAVGKVQNVSGWNRRTAGEALSGRKSEYDYLTDRQRDTITLYAKAGDFQAVADYYNALLPDLWAKAAAESEGKHEAFGKEHPILSMGSQFASGMTGAIPSTLETVAGNVRNAVTGEYRDIDPNAPAYALTAASSAQAQGAEERLKNHPLLSIMRGGTVSAAQNLFLMWLGGGSAAGRQAINTVLGGIALSSAGQSGYESLKEGKSAGRALVDALVDAGIETATEEIGMERWFKVLNQFDPKFVGNSLRQMAHQLPAQMIVEGMEEVLGNELSQTWDMLSEGERSEYSNRVRTLEASGMSRADAENETALELHVLRDAKAFAEAAFSVLLMDGAPASLSAIRQRNTFAAMGRDIRTNGGPRAVNSTISKGLAFAEDTPARQAAEKLSEKWKDGKGAVTNKDLGRLSFLNGNALADVFRIIEQRGDATARAKLREVSARLDLDIYDKVALKDLRELVRFSQENTIPTFEEFLAGQSVDSVAASANEMTERLSRLDLDANGRPLVSWQEAVKEIKERLPAATEREIQEIYHQYRNDNRTVLFGGHRLTLSAFTDLMRQSTDGEKLSAKQISGYFNQAILDTLDGSDAYERYVLTDEQRQAVEDDVRKNDDLPFYWDEEERERTESVNLAGDLETKRRVARTENFKIDETGTAAKNSENAPQSQETANVDADRVSGKNAIDESVATRETEAFEPGLDYNDPVTVEYARTLDKATRVKADTLSRLLGKRVRFAESVGGGIANAEIAGNEIVLSRAELERAQEDGGLVWKILGHELTHGIQQDAKNAYAPFRDAVVKEAAVRKHARNILEYYKLRGLSITAEAALDEAVADYGGQIIRDTDTAERFIERNRQDKSLLEKVRDAIVKLVRKLTGAEKKQVQTVQSLFDAALDEAAKAVRNGETAAQKDSGTKKYSLNGYSPHQIENWSGSKSIVVYENHEQLDQFVQDALDGKNLGKKLYFGAVSEELATRIKQDTGLNVEGYNCTLRASEIRKIVKDHGRESTEKPRGQRAITAEDFTNIPEIIQNPDAISLSENLYEGKPVILFTKTINGRTTVVSYVSTKHMDMTVQTMYSGQNKGSLATTPSKDNLRSHTSETLSGTASTNNITQTTVEIKRETKFSLKGTEDAAELDTMLQSLTDRDGELSKQQSALIASPEYKELSAALDEARKKNPSRFNPSAEVKAAREAISKWERESGYREISDERKNLSDDLFAVRKAIREESARRTEQEAKAKEAPHTAQLKEKQFQILQKSNPMRDNYHTGVRSVEDIKTYQEAFDEAAEEYDGADFTPDYKVATARKALKSGKITVYSSYPIREGTFVTPSKMEAQSYAGTPHGYKMTVPLTDVAWVDIMEGEYTGKPGGTRFSLTGTENAERLEQLIRQNRELEEQVQKYQRRLAEAQTLSGARRYYTIAEVNRLTEPFLKDWQSSLSVGNVRPDMLKLVNHMRAGPNGDGSMQAASDAVYQEWITETERLARNLARRVIESAVAEVENPELETLREIRGELKSARIAYDDLKAEMRAEFEPWRRRNQLRMGLRKNGRSVDTYWNEWNSRYGETFFPSDIVSTSDMLRHLSELLDRTATEYENPFDRYDTLEVVEDCKNALLDAIMNFDEQRELPAADRQTIRDSAYQKGIRDAEARMSGQREKLESDRARVRYERTQFREEQAWARQAVARIEADLEKARKAVREERADGQRKLDNYKDWQKRLREQRIETAKKNAVRRQLEQISGRLNRRNMPEGERAFLNSIFHNIDAIAKERIGVGVEQLFKNLDYYWKRIDEGSDLYDEDFLENPFQTLDGQMNLAEAANQRKLSGQEMTDVKKGLSGLSAEQLRRVLDFLRAFDHAQQTRNEMIAANDSRALNVQADEVIEAVRKAKGFSVPLAVNMMRPRTFFRRLTGYRQSNALVSAAEDMQAGERARDDYQRRGYETVLSKFAEGLGYSNIQNMSEEKRREAVKAITKAFQSLSGAEAAKEANLIEIHGVDPTTRQEVTAYITRGMRAALYMHSLNEDNMRHIRYGGFVIPGVEKGGWNAYRKGDYKQAYMKGRQHVRLSISQIHEIVQDMTPEEKALAGAAAWYYDRMSKPELSSTHEKLKGWSPFHVENYMPIETDEMFRAVDYESMRPDGTLGTPGFSLERVKSGNTIILRDLNLTLLDSISRHSRFVGLAIPVRNMNKLLNRNQVILADEGDALRMVFSEDEARDIEARAAEINSQNPESKANPVLRAVKEFQGADGVYKFQDAMRSHSIHKSVRDNVTSHFGKEANYYITKLMRDMTGVNKERDPIGRMISTLTGNYAGAVLTLNTSTALVQTASYPTAAAVLGPMPLLKAMRNLPSVITGNVDLERIHIYTPRLWQRSQGYSTWENETMSAEHHTLPRTVRKGVNIIQGMDVGTTTLLWKACEYYVDDENARRRKNGVATLEKGTLEQIAKGQSAYYRAVADVYNRVLEETQPSYGVMERPQVLRSQNELVRLTNMFKTQMYQNFNILYDAFQEMGARRRDMDAERNADTEAAFRKAGTDVAYALTSQVAAALIAAVIKGAFAVFTGSDDKYKDNEGNLTGGSWLGGVARGTVATFPGFVAYGSEAYSALATLIDRGILKSFGMDPFFRETFYGVNFSMFSSLKNTVTKTGSALSGLISALASVAQGFDDEEEGGRVDWPGLAQKVLSAATDWSMFLGLPARNMEKLLYGVIRTSAIASMGDTTGMFATRKLLSTTLDTEIYRLLYQSLADGDLETFKAMAEDVQKNFQTSSGKPVTGKTIRDRMLSMYRTEEQEKGTSRLGQAARDYIGAVEKYSVETPEKFTEGDLSPAQYRAYRDEYEREFRTLADAIDRSSTHGSMTDKQRLDVKANAAKLATEFALEHQSGGEYEVGSSWMRWAVGGKDYNVTADMAILFKEAYDSTESDKDKSGKTISGSRKKKTLTLAKEWIPGLSKQQLLYLQSFYWEPENSKLKALKENGYQKSAAN